MKNILIIPGSLRTTSSSFRLIPHLVAYLPDGCNPAVSTDLGELPAFNDASEPAPPVLAWRGKVATADGVIFITPEFAFGVPGALKNALDWLVSSGELVNKPTAVITAATGGEHAHRSLILTLSALTAQPSPDCDLLISYIRSKLDEKGNITDADLSRSLKKVVTAFVGTLT